jgi:serine/threonine protein kinase
MAPEVGMEKPYNELCDVYSFGVLLWEMMALIKPYSKIDMVGLISKVWKNSPDAKRPCPSLVTKGNFLTAQGFWNCWGPRRRQRQRRSNSVETRGSPASLQSLVESCWSHSLEERPSMSIVEYQLREELMAIRKGHSRAEDRHRSYKRRRSTFFLDEEVEEDPSNLY